MKNNISTTLFRFSSLRAPQKITPVKASLQFVSELDSLQTRLFYTTVENRPPGTSKADALHLAARDFEKMHSQLLDKLEH